MTLKQRLAELLFSFDDDGNLLAGKTLKFDCKAFTMTGTPTLRTAIELLANGAEVTIEDAPKRPREVWFSTDLKLHQFVRPRSSWAGECIRFIEDTPREVTDADIHKCWNFYQEKRGISAKEAFGLALQHYENERLK